MKEELWLARDKNDSLGLYQGKPSRDIDIFEENANCWYVSELEEELYPEVTWENSPVRIKLIID